MHRAPGEMGREDGEQEMDRPAGMRENLSVACGRKRVGECVPVDLLPSRVEASLSVAIYRNERNCMDPLSRAEREGERE